MGVIFSLRTKKVSGLAPLQCRVQVKEPKVNIIVATPLEIDVKLFEGKDKAAKLEKFYRSEAGRELYQKEIKIEDEINFILKQGKAITKEQVHQIIHNICYSDQIKAEEEAKAAAAAAEAERNKITFTKYREIYLGQIRSGGRSTYAGRNFAPATIVAISVSFNRLRDFEKKKRRVYDFDDIDMTFYRDFTAFMKDIKYGLNTIGKTIRVIKTVMRCAEEDGYHSNHNYMAHSFKAPRSEVDSIYLTREEIQKITDIDLSNQCQGMRDARDIFLIGVWTAQRVSDYNNIQKEDIRKETIRSWDEDGNLSEKTIRTIHFVQQKTGKKVVIPCNKALRTILDKYPEELPHLSEQKINLYLKEIGKLCKFNDDIEIRNTKGGSLHTDVNFEFFCSENYF